MVDPAEIALQRERIRVVHERERAAREARTRENRERAQREAKQFAPARAAAMTLCRDYSDWLKDLGLGKNDSWSVFERCSGVPSGADWGNKDSYTGVGPTGTIDLKQVMVDPLLYGSAIREKISQIEQRYGIKFPYDK